MSSKHDTNARRPGKEARHHIAVMRNLLMSEIDDFVAGQGNRANQQHRARYTGNYAAAWKTSWITS